MKAFLISRSAILPLALLMAHCMTVQGNDLSLAMKGRTFNAQGEYVIAANDRLSIQILGGSDVNGEFTVSQQGTISLPLIGAEKASGMTEKSLMKHMTARYTAFVKNPVVSVGVIGHESYKAFITGDVRRPGVFTFQDKTTLLQGIATAGGLGDFAKGNIILHRQGRKGLIERYVTTYDNLLNGTEQLDGFVLERGDVVHIF